MCRWPYFFGPLVPGALAPVNAEDDMTEPVGVRKCRLYTKGYGTEIAALTERIAALEQGGGGAETGTFHVQIGNTTIQGGQWVKINKIVYFYLPSTLAAAAETDTQIQLIPDSGQPGIPECKNKNLEFHYVSGNNEYAVFGQFMVTAGGYYALITNLCSYMQNFSTGDNRSTLTSGTPYYLQYMTVQFTAITD